MRAMKLFKRYLRCGDFYYVLGIGLFIDFLDLLFINLVNIYRVLFMFQELFQVLGIYELLVLWSLRFNGRKQIKNLKNFKVLDCIGVV